MEKRNDYTKYSNLNNKFAEKIAPKAEPVVEPVAEPVEEPTVAEVIEEIVEKKGELVNCTRLNVREAPNANANIVCVITADTNIVIDEDESTDDFYAVCTESGAEGYCMKKFIKIIP